MRPKIPRHRVDKQPEYIPITDTAWDLDRVADETDDAEDVSDKVDHPFWQYHLGRTRYDLDAPCEFGGKEACPRDYLDRAKAPEAWKLRRLNLEEWYEIIGLMRSDRSPDAYIKACRIGVVGVDNYEGPALKGLTRNGALSSADMRILHEEDPGVLGGVTVCGVPWTIESLPYQIGQAVCSASSPPTEAEKKASGS